MNYFCSVHLQSKKDEERMIYIVLESDETERPLLTKKVLIANLQYQEFVQKYRPKLVLAEYVVYATEQEVYASLQDEVFNALISDENTEKVGQSEITVDCVKDKVSGRKKKKKISPVLAAVTGGSILIVGVFGYGIGNMKGKSNAQVTETKLNAASGVTDENGMIIPEQAAIAEGAEQITVSIDRSYSAVPTEDLQLKGEVIEGVAYITLPEFDKTDFFTHVPGYTWGFTTDPDGKKIEYYGGTSYAFSKDTKLYRVLVKYGGGSGTKDDPYLINYFDQLELMGEEKARGYFKQTADIVFPNYAVHSPIDTVNELKNDPNTEYFSYDGGGFHISNLTNPLFGKVSGAVIENVNVSDSTITTIDYKNFGFIVCEAYNYRYAAENGSTYETGETLIKNCTVSHSAIKIAYPETEEETAAVVTAEVVIPPNLIEYDEDGNVISKPTEPANNTPTKSGEYAIGAVTGLGGQIENCYVTDFGIYAQIDDYFLYAGGISGKPANVKDSAVYYFSVSGNVFNAGGIAGSSGGARMYDANGRELPNYYGGNIQGCTARDVILTTEISAGGIVGESSTNADAALISNCCAINLSLISGIYDPDGNMKNAGTCGGVIGADGNENNGHNVMNTVSPAEFSVIGTKRVSSYDDTVRQAPAYAFYQENILTVLNRNTVNPDKPKEIYTGSFKLDAALFGDENGSLPFPKSVADLFEKTISAEENEDE